MKRIAIALSLIIVSLLILGCAGFKEPVMVPGTHIVGLPATPAHDGKANLTEQEDMKRILYNKQFESPSKRW